MTSPIDAFLSWYSSLPVSHRHDIAGVVGNSLMGYESIDFGDSPDAAVEKFIAITTLAKQSPFKEVATVLSLKGFIQFFFIDKRSDRAGWSQSKGVLNELAESDDSELFQKMAREARFREEQWIASCKKWDELVSQQISDRALNSFVE